MGPQRILQAIAVVASTSIALAADAAPSSSSERIAVVDLGPSTSPVAPGEAALPNGSAGLSSNDDARRALEAAVIAAGFQPVTGDDIEHALAGRAVERDEAQLAAAIGDAQRAFGELKCGDVAPAAQRAIGIAAARQAAGRPAPELARAWTLLLLCADRENRPDAAITAATHLRALGGSPDVPPAVLAKYPSLDAIAAGELVQLEIDADAPGAVIWIDFQRAGTAPLKIEIPAGEHVIAAAAGSKRGWASGVAVRSQKQLRVPLHETAGAQTDVAERVAGWKGAVPPASELAWLFGRVRTRIALIRHGDTVEAWGHIGRSEPPRLLGGPGAVAPVAQVERVLAVVADRVRAWSDRSPDPDQPLLVEDGSVRRIGVTPGGPDDEPRNKPTKWWVYAAIAGAAAIGATIILVNEAGSDRQRVELMYP